MLRNTGVRRATACPTTALKPDDGSARRLFGGSVSITSPFIRANRGHTIGSNECPTTARKKNTREQRVG